MKIRRRIKFIWGAGQTIRGRWYFGLFGLYGRREGMREDGLAISVRGLLVASGLAAVLGWVALAAAGFWIWQRNPYSTLTYSDALFYPLRRSEVARKKGQAYLAQGIESARQGRWGDALNLLRLGLARVPEDRRGRLTLAQFYQLTNQYTLAVRTLTEVPGDVYPGRPYIDAVLRLTAQGEDFGTAAAMCNRYLPVVAKRGLGAEQRWLVERRHAALSAAGRHDEALAAAEAEPAGDGREERRVLSLLGLGRSDEARKVLAEWRSRPGAPQNTVGRLEARACREARRFDEMEQALAELRRRAPAEPSPLVFGIVQQAMAGRGAEATAALENFIFRFGGFADNLALAAAPLAEIGNVPLVERCLAAARERGFATGRFEVWLLDALLAHGRWDEAGRLLARMPPAAEKAVGEQVWRSWLQALVETVRNPAEGAQTALVEMLRGRPWTMVIFRRTIEALVRAERITAARDVAEIGLRAYPANVWLQTKAAEVRERARAIEAAAVATVEPPRRPAAGSARPAVAAPKARPDPVADASPEELLRQMQECQATDDMPGALRAARLYLTGDRRRAERLIGVAREWAQAGNRPAAELLIKEVLRRHEAFPPARRLQAELDAGQPRKS